MNPATVLTTSRLFIAPVFAYAFVGAVRGGLSLPLLWISFALAVCIELTDAFDGPLARRRKEVTDFGKIFDPICDSLSRQTVFLAFLLGGIIPLWMFLIFLYRDALMSFLRILCAVEGMVIAARVSGKLKAVFQAIATFTIITLLLAQAYSPGTIPGSLWGRHPGFWIMLPVALYILLSFFDYFIPYRKVFRRSMTPSG
jgi:CDP-diacylglycerol--glycerol-3-phosphate 3-phosphatidyltransferase